MANEILLNFRFNSRGPKAGENAADFLVALRHLAEGCGFAEYLNKALRNQFVFGMTNTKIQSRLLEKTELTLEQAVSIADAYESAERGFEEMSKESEGIVEKVRMTR